MQRGVGLNVGKQWQKHLQFGKQKLDSGISKAIVTMKGKIENMY